MHVFLLIGGPEKDRFEKTGKNPHGFTGKTARPTRRHRPNIHWSPLYATDAASSATTPAALDQPSLREFAEKRPTLVRSFGVVDGP